MIYFDKDKKAYSYKIENPIATVTDEIWMQYANTDKWDIEQGKFVDITLRPEYLEKLAKEENAKKIADIKEKLRGLDLQRIRSIAEPCVKDTVTGQSWLEYYNIEIQKLREELQTLEAKGV